MPLTPPEFDFDKYNPQDPWNFPGDRLVVFGINALESVRPVRTRYVLKYRFPDLRFGIFHELAQACHSLMCVGMWQRGEASEASWWHAQPEFGKAYQKRTWQNFNIGIRGIAQTGFVSALVFKLESALWQVLEALDKHAPELQMTPQDIGPVLLERLDLADFLPLMELWWTMRNALLQNGNHCPPDGSDLSLRYKGKFYTFLNNEEIRAEDWGYVDEWEFLLYLIRESLELLQAIFDHAMVQLVPQIVMRHQQTRPEPGL